MCTWHGFSPPLTSKSPEAAHRYLSAGTDFPLLRSWPWTLLLAGKIMIPFPVEISYPFAPKIFLVEEKKKNKVKKCSKSRKPELTNSMACSLQSGDIASYQAFLSQSSHQAARATSEKSGEPMVSWKKSSQDFIVYPAFHFHKIAHSCLFSHGAFKAYLCSVCLHKACFHRGSCNSGVNVLGCIFCLPGQVVNPWFEHELLCPHNTKLHWSQIHRFARDSNDLL